MSGQNKVIRPPEAQQERNEFMSEASAEMMKMMEQMFSVMAETSLTYYEKPEVIARFAKLNKKYYDRLLKEGFTKEEAILLVSSSPFNSGPSGQ